mmetsp:Transcript_67964/g.164366  ORF Transcript_67964/g.164366 Transcript_67964/m.164366 type:complete len:233 (-) Transcript_67964:295-993(-)
MWLKAPPQQYGGEGGDGDAPAEQHGPLRTTLARQARARLVVVVARRVAHVAQPAVWPLQPRFARPLEANATNTAGVVTKVRATAQIVRSVGRAVVPGDQRQRGQRRAFVSTLRADRAHGALDGFIRWAAVVVAGDAHAFDGRDGGSSVGHSVRWAMLACRLKKLGDQWVVGRPGAAVGRAANAVVASGAGIAIRHGREVRPVANGPRWAKGPRGRAAGAVGAFRARLRGVRR